MKAIVCMTLDGRIGRDNNLLVKLKSDMSHFRSYTDGNTVVMGRKTWESLPEKNRPLKNRRNIVLTSAESLPGAEIAHSVKEVLEMTKGDDVCVIGGGSVYAQFISYIDEISITYVYNIPTRDTDVKFPKLELLEWSIYDTSELLEEDGISYKFAVARRDK